MAKTNKKSNIFKIKLENTRQNKKPLPLGRGREMLWERGS